MLVEPSVERKLKLPPVQPSIPSAGQFRVKVPAAAATSELMVTLDPPDAEPPELIRLP